MFQSVRLHRIIALRWDSENVSVNDLLLNRGKRTAVRAPEAGRRVIPVGRALPPSSALLLGFKVRAICLDLCGDAGIDDEASTNAALPDLLAEEWVDLK